MESFDKFSKRVKAVNFKKYVQFTASFGSKKQIGCDYYVYVCLDTLEVINPYTKKHAGRKYKSFFSGFSSEDAKRKAYDYIESFEK